MLKAEDMRLKLIRYPAWKLKRKEINMKKGVFCLLMYLIVTALFLTGCQSAYYKTMEAFGYHKREILVDRVEDARDAQEDAKEQFQSALEKFSAVVDFSGGQLEEKYKELKAELESSESKAKKVSKRIGNVEDVAEALFDEWESELSQYTNDNLRQSSEQKLGQTRQRYLQLIDAMKRAEAKIDPVLSAFRDQVLFLKHNLNAQAIASLHDELASVEAEIASLIKEMEASIAEADSFIKAMGRE
jgi:Skp family chaperone for outer membrane proteins